MEGHRAGRCGTCGNCKHNIDSYVARTDLSAEQLQVFLLQSQVTHSDDAAAAAAADDDDGGSGDGCRHAADIKLSTNLK